MSWGVKTEKLSEVDEGHPAYKFRIQGSNSIVNANRKNLGSLTESNDPYFKAWNEERQSWGSWGGGAYGYVDEFVLFDSDLGKEYQEKVSYHHESSMGSAPIGGVRVKGKGNAVEVVDKVVTPLVKQVSIEDKKIEYEKFMATISSDRPTVSDNSEESSAPVLPVMGIINVLRQLKLVSWVNAFRTQNAHDGKDSQMEPLKLDMSPNSLVWHADRGLGFKVTISRSKGFSQDLHVFSFTDAGTLRRCLMIVIDLANQNLSHLPSGRNYSNEKTTPARASASFTEAILDSFRSAKDRANIERVADKASMREEYFTYSKPRSKTSNEKKDKDFKAPSGNKPAANRR